MRWRPRSVARPGSFPGADGLQPHGFLGRYNILGSFIRAFRAIHGFSLGTALVVPFLVSLPTPAGSPTHYKLDDPPHRYWQRTPRDRLTRLKEDLESGRLTLDRSGEKAFVLGLLEVLDIPASSQLLVFSTTSLQTSLISPSNPRALYFNADTYLGFIPRGRIEVISLDPELGAIFHIFDIPRDGQVLKIERSDRCLNCHQGSDTRYVPGLLAKSVIPGPNRGSLLSFRDEESGHGIPFSERFGGWYLTGSHHWTNLWANLSGRLYQGDLTKIPIDPATAFDPAKYPVSTSDVLAHLIHEHQVGFVNRAVEATYLARTLIHAAAGELRPEEATEIDEQARILSRYLLFADETPLPAGGLDGDARFTADFVRDRRAAADGTSLKDLDLQSRLFRHRCSYMIYSPIVEGMPAELRRRVFAKLNNALSPVAPDPEFGYLPAEERAAIRRILKETLPDAIDWK